MRIKTERYEVFPYYTPSEARIRVLWVSKHLPLPAQVHELEAKLGKVAIYVMRGKIASAEEVMEVAKKLGADYVVPVLPLSIVARLVELAKSERTVKVLWSEMTCVLTTKNRGEAEAKVREAPDRRNLVEYADGTFRVFEFKGFKRLIDVRLVLEDLVVDVDKLIEEAIQLEVRDLINAVVERDLEHINEIVYDVVERVKMKLEDKEVRDLNTEEILKHVLNHIEATLEKIMHEDIPYVLNYIRGWKESLSKIS